MNVTCDVEALDPAYGAPAYRAWERLFGDDERDQQAEEGAAANAPEAALEQAHDPDGMMPPPPLPHPGTP